MENFAEYILAEEDCLKENGHSILFTKRTGIFDNSVILKTQNSKIFLWK